MTTLTVGSTFFLVVWLLSISVDAASFEQNRYVNDTTSSFIVSETTELACTCKGRHGEVDMEETYYRVFVDEITESSFTRGTPQVSACNRNVSFYAYKEKNRRFNMKTTCLTVISTYDKFTVIQLAFNTTGYEWNEGDAGFDLDGHHVDARAPCSQCGDRCTCPQNGVIYDLGMRTCCYPGVPLASYGTSGVTPMSTSVSLWVATFLLAALRMN